MPPLTWPEMLCFVVREGQAGTGAETETSGGKTPRRGQGRNFGGFGGDPLFPNYSCEFMCRDNCSKVHAIVLQPDFGVSDSTNHHINADTFLCFLREDQAGTGAETKTRGG